MSKDIKHSGTSYLSSTNFVVKMWIRLEDLDDFRDFLRRKFEELKDIKNQRIIFLDYNNATLSPDTCLQNLANNTTAKTPLLVRYPLSTATSKCNIPHTSGSLSLLRERVVIRFKELQTEEFYFFNDKTKEEIRNKFDFNILVFKTEPNGNDYSLKLKDYKSLASIPRFNLNDLPSLEHSFTEGELNGFVADLQRTLDAFNDKFGINEMTAREYISTFMKIAVCHIKKYTNKSAQLNVAIDLDGSHGYSPVDYMGTAQVLVQIHSAIEQQLGKQPIVHISKEYPCIFTGEMESEKEVLKHITQILQVQAIAFGDDGYPSKRQ
ncbi:14829_t:CDS:2, partial [Gigaspora rosea]